MQMKYEQEEHKQIATKPSFRLGAITAVGTGFGVGSGLALGVVAIPASMIMSGLNISSKGGAQQPTFKEAAFIIAFCSLLGGVTIGTFSVAGDYTYFKVKNSSVPGAVSAGVYSTYSKFRDTFFPDLAPAPSPEKESPEVSSNNNNSL